MNYILAKAIRSFQLGKEIKTRRSEPFPLTRSEFIQLQAKKLVEEAGDDVAPKPLAGTPSSALPAGQASPKKTAKESGAGEKRPAKASKGPSA